MSKILIVDDDTGIRNLCYDMFTRDGHEVLTVLSGRQLLSMMATEKPDLILMDLNIPDEEGLSLLKRIPKEANAPRVPVIVFSGYIDSDLEKKAFEAGASEVIAKGGDLKEFRTKINKILESKSRNVPEASSSSERRESILVVDDEEGIRNMLKTFFERKGYPTLTAANGEEALKIVARDKPPMILLDITMPGMDGLVTLKKILEIHPQAGVVMATGAQDEAIVKEATALGSYAYVFKPFDLRYLELVVLTRLVMSF